MKGRLFAVTLCLLAGAETGHGLLACGDKFLVLSRGTRFERAPAARQTAAILLYANPASGLPQTLAGLSVEATLRKAGYRPVSVASADDFERALRTGGWDVVLVDLADAPAASAPAEGRGAPLVLPVALHSTREALADAKKRYAGVINSPTRGQAFVDAIDDAMTAKVRRQAKPGASGVR